MASLPFHDVVAKFLIILCQQVSRASKYVTRDVGVPWQTRFKRARALLLLGKVSMQQCRYGKTILNSLKLFCGSRVTGFALAGVH